MSILGCTTPTRLEETNMRFSYKHAPHASPQGPGGKVEARDLDEACEKVATIRHTAALGPGTQYGYWHRWVVRECGGRRRRRVLRLPNGKRWRAS